MAPRLKKMITNGISDGVDIRSFSTNLLACGSKLNFIQRYTGGMNRAPARAASIHHPSKGKAVVCASRIPHRKANEIQNKGISGLGHH